MRLVNGLMDFCTPVCRNTFMLYFSSLLDVSCFDASIYKQIPAMNFDSYLVANDPVIFDSFLVTWPFHKLVKGLLKLMLDQISEIAPMPRDC